MVPKRILIAEDYPDILDTVALIVEQMGHIALRAQDGIQALQLAEETRPDLAILDIGLPGIDGVQLTKRLKDAPNLRHIPLVAMTAGSRGKEALEAGCCALLEKPFSVAPLRTTIEEVLAVEDYFAGGLEGAEREAFEKHLRTDSERTH